MSTAAIVVLVVVGLVVLFAVGWFVAARVRSRRLRDRFGPEYDRHLAEAGNRRAAERELAEREKRHAELDLRPLAAEARRRYAGEWIRVQEPASDSSANTVTAASRCAGRLKYRSPTRPDPARTATWSGWTGPASGRGPSCGRPSNACRGATRNATISVS